jgi:hypothetical protein
LAACGITAKPYGPPAAPQRPIRQSTSPIRRTTTLGRVVKRAERGTSETKSKLGLRIVIEDATGHEANRNHDLIDLTVFGDEPVVELRDSRVPSNEMVDFTVNINLANEDQPEVIRERSPEPKKVREIGALVVALFLLSLTIPEKTRPIAVPTLAVVSAYYFGRNTHKKH